MSWLGDQVFLRVPVPRSIACHATAGPVNFHCQLTTLSLERMTSLVMDSVLTLTSDLGPILGGMAVTSKFHPLHGTLYALCPQVVGGPCGL